MKDKTTQTASNNALNLLLQNQRNFEETSVQQVLIALDYLLVNFPQDPGKIIQLHQALLFSIAYPAQEKVLQLAENMMQKLVQTATQIAEDNPDELFNSGITGTLVCAQFGLLLNQWLLRQNLSLLELSAIEGENTDLAGKLTYTLDTVEQELMPDSAGYFKNWQKTYLGEIKGKDQLLAYYINACMQMTGSLIYKERTFANFELFTQFRLDPRLSGLSLGRQKKGSVFFHTQGIQKKMDLVTAFAQGKPKSIRLNATEKEFLGNLARGTMASLLRETDTFTYTQTHETELFDMGSGITIALYYMIPEQKFALQSYIGYLLYKNGVPMAYGGCWLFACQAAFGVNVLPPYRGGESANVVCQILRLYHHRFKLTQFTVDPYQIGKGNSDGIESAAFWFYYKLGFRPMQSKFAELAEMEMQIMSRDKSYKTPKKTLIKLANSELYWKQPDSKEPYYPLPEVGKIISHYVCEKFGGNRKLSLDQARTKYQKRFKTKLPQTSFLNNLLLTLDAIGAFEKLPETELKKVCDAYIWKSENEAKAFLDLQKLKKFFLLFQT